jgi:hypothetical protein
MENSFFLSFVFALLPSVNFINILRAAFVAKCLRKKNLKSQTVTREKLSSELSYKKVARNMLMKLTPY